MVCAVSDSPFLLVTKVGAVVLRAQPDGYRLLAIQPRPKPHTPQDLPPIGLVRGTRAFRMADGVLVDADHDGRTAPPLGAVLEPVTDTLRREIEEEAGVTPAMLAAALLVDLGPLLFASTKKEPYPIHWFVVLLRDADAAELPLAGMQDSLSSCWVSRAEFEALVAEKKASPGYLAVLDAALEALSAVRRSVDAASFQ